MQVAQKVGRSREYVANSIRLLGLPETILNALKVGDISDGHARTLLMLNDRPTEQDVVFREILLKKLSVREVERISRKIATDKVRKKNWQNSDLELIEIEKQFTETFGTRVQIQKTDFGGKLVIDYFAPEDLRKILDVVHKAETLVSGTHESKLLSHIMTAVPLESAESTTQSEEVLAEIVMETSQQEDVFTRHDTLYAPEHQVTEEEMQTEYNETDSVSSVLEKVADAQHTDTNTQPVKVPAVEPPKESDDSDLYSIRNFSL
jgi:hypothetical protein